VAMSDRNVRPEVDVAAWTLALLDGVNVRFVASPRWGVRRTDR
jgi:hypothetical protein